LTHDKEKNRLIRTEGNVYLKELGVTTAEGKVKKDMQDKFRQINKYIEILDGAIKELKNEKSLHIADMGAGKGYLTFSLYDYLSQSLHIDTTMTGVELRPKLVKDCNAIAQKAGFTQLQFVEGRIENIELPAFDVLVALHACNTATDDAIYRGIVSKAKLIICSPCCHKQVRQEISKDNALSAITKHGILKERQAEIITDAIRALYLEAYGYKTQVFEFIATEHTPKNIIITAIKVKEVTEADPAKLEEVAQLKALLGVKHHYLDTLDWKI
ncbi:MAG: SAM-dependent methyltransferase, partial [Bacteroidales bacterium]|nr:SAM-dependent methyltransferase [Bacteroidales bacterium]